MKPALSVLAVVVLLTGAARAAEPRGFVEGRFAFMPGTTGTSWQLVERVRPTFQASLSDRLELVTTIEAGLAQGRDQTEELDALLRAAGFGPWLEANGLEAPAHRNSVLRIDGSDDYLEVDRLYLDYYGEHFDLRAGRQALNWGSAQFFNPTDPFPEVLFAEPWRPRRGVNALRVSVPFGELNDVSAVVASSDALDEMRAAARVRLNRWGTDFALVGAWRGDVDTALVGIDLRGTLGVGWWVEAAWLLDADPHEELSVGIDYSFPVLERATLFVQYYRNGAGSTDANTASTLLGRRDPFAPFVTGRDYLLAGSSLVILPELSASVFALQNLNDGSGLAVPTVSYAVTDWLDVAASAQVTYALAGSGELRPSADALKLEVPSTTPGRTLTADLSGLVPTATFTLWTRASF